MAERLAAVRVGVGAARGVMVVAARAKKAATRVAAETVVAGVKEGESMEAVAKGTEATEAVAKAMESMGGVAKAMEAMEAAAWVVVATAVAAWVQVDSSAGVAEVSACLGVQ